MHSIKKIRNSKWIVSKKESEIRNNDFLVQGLLIVVRGFRFFKKTINYQQLTINYSRGFSLIELLVVISILGLLAGLGIASFSSFNRASQLSNAASQLRSDIRLAQSRALSGDKGFENGNRCDNDNLHILAGWYISLTENPTGFDRYQITGVCLFMNPANGTIQIQSTFGQKSYNLPSGVRICDIASSTVNDSANVLFRPLAASAYIFSSSLTPPFFTVGTADNFSSTPATSALTVKLTREGLSCGSVGTYQVIIEQSGEVNEQKI